MVLAHTLLDHADLPSSLQVPHHVPHPLLQTFQSHASLPSGKGVFAHLHLKLQHPERPQGYPTCLDWTGRVGPSFPLQQVTDNTIRDRVLSAQYSGWMEGSHKSISLTELVNEKNHLEILGESGEIGSICKSSTHFCMNLDEPIYLNYINP